MNDVLESTILNSSMLPVLESNGQLVQDVVGGANVMIHPGQWCFGRGDFRVAAVMGSSVVLVMWSASQRWGAACCFAHAKPTTGKKLPAIGPSLYGVDVLSRLEARLNSAGCVWADVELTLAGGAHHRDGDAGALNVAWAQRWAKTHALVPRMQDVGGRVLRRLTFQVSDGSVHVAHGGRLSTQEV